LRGLSDDAPRHIERSHSRDGKGQRPPRPKDYSQVWEVLQTADTINPGHEASRSIIASKIRLLALKSLIIKTP
jgi:hypothetical protein